MPGSIPFIRSIELVFEPELIKEAKENAKLIDLTETDHVLLSEEDVEKEIKIMPGYVDFVFWKIGYEDMIMGCIHRKQA